ncbi:MAG: hypothetical protein JNM17_20730 [Archangium sp.]|nr:hypothetical protein [Archangium sp.]
MSLEMRSLGVREHLVWIEAILPLHGPAQRSHDSERLSMSPQTLLNRQLLFALEQREVLSAEFI